MVMVMVSAVGGFRSDLETLEAVFSGNRAALSSARSRVPSGLGRNTLIAYWAATLLSSLTQSRFELRTLSRSEGARDSLKEEKRKN